MKKRSLSSASVESPLHRNQKSVLLLQLLGEAHLPSPKPIELLSQSVKAAKGSLQPFKLFSSKPIPFGELAKLKQSCPNLTSCHHLDQMHKIALDSGCRPVLECNWRCKVNVPGFDFSTEELRYLTSGSLIQPPLKKGQIVVAKENNDFESWLIQSEDCDPETISKAYSNLWQHLQPPPSATDATASPPVKLVKVTRSFPWQDVLLDYLKYPEKHADSIVYKSDQFTIIRDAYPKAKVHLLMIPNKQGIDSDPRTLDKQLPLLLEMKQELESFLKLPQSEVLFQGIKRSDLITGFHNVPSMNQLHLHIISSDLSRCKNRKHWDSFQWSSIWHLDDVIQALSSGSSSFKELQQQHDDVGKPLCCHKCQKTFKNMGQVFQAHISSHPISDPILK